MKMNIKLEQLKKLLIAHCRYGLVFPAAILIVGLVAIVIQFNLAASKADRLIAKAPLETVLYVSIRQPVWPEKKLVFTETPLGGYLPIIAEKLKVADAAALANLIDSSAQAALMAVNDNNDIGYLLYVIGGDNQPIQQNPAGAEFYAAVDNVAIIASDEELLDQAKQIFNGQTFSLISRVDYKDIGDSRLNVYLNSRNLAGALNSFGRADYQTLGRLIKSDIYLAADYRAGNWQFAVNGNLPGLGQSGRRLAETMPDDAVLLASGFKLQDMIAYLGTDDIRLASDFVRTVDTYKFIYRVQADNLNIELLQKGGDWLFYRPSADNYFNCDFIAVYSDVSEQAEDQLKGLIKTFYAMNVPDTASHILPDDSEILEVYAQPDKWQWVKIEKDGLPEYYRLFEPKLSLDFVLIRKDNLFYISNSIDRLKAYFDGNNLQIGQYLPKISQKSAIIFNNSSSVTGSINYLPRGIFGLLSDGDNILGKFSEK